MKKVLAVILAVALVFSLCACGEKAVVEEPEPTPEPTPTPTPEPIYEKGGAVTVEGTELASGSFMIDGAQCVISAELESASGRSAPGDGKYTDIDTWCRDNHMGTLYDEEFDHLYCNYSSGDWTYPEGYNVPVMMYHEVQPDEYGGDGDTVKLSNFKEQMKWLHENGYTTIFFDELEHVDQIEKPIILTFDDGYVGNYEYVRPIMEEYDMKATIFYFVHPIYNVSRYLTQDQVVELSKNEHFQIESHTMNHPYLDSVDKTQQEYELEQSKLEITRLTGNIPYVLAYPYGDTTGYIVDRIHEGCYRFGVKMVGLRSYTTSDDCATVWRFWPNRDMDIYTYQAQVSSAFPSK